MESIHRKQLQGRERQKEDVNEGKEKHLCMKLMERKRVSRSSQLSYLSPSTFQESYIESLMTFPIIQSTVVPVF